MSAQVLRGIVPAALHVLEAAVGRDGLGRVEPRAGFEIRPMPESI